MIPQIRKILYATDLSKNSAYAFLYAVDMAKRHCATIVILHAIEPLRQSISSEAGIGAVEALRQARKEERWKDIEAIKNSLQSFCRKTEAEIGSPCASLVSEVVVPSGHPVEEILKAAEEGNCDAIVLGTHGKGFLRQTFLGSVAVSVLERTRKPIFIIPLPSEKTNLDLDTL